MLLMVPVTALFIACGEHPNSGPSRRINGLAIQGTPRADRARSGTGWTINAPIPEPLGVAQGATVASSDGTLIYHIGGITGALTPTNKVWVYSTADNSWFTAADIPVTPGIRTFGAAVELNGFIYVFGGIDGTSVLDTTWIFDEAKDAWFRGANMPAPRFGSAVATDGTVIWVVRGSDDPSVGSESETTWRYEPGTDTWFSTPWGPIPMGRLRAAILPNGNIHLFGGGFDGNTQLVFNPGGPSPYFPPPIPIGVTDPAIVTDGVLIYVAGGGGPAPRTAGLTQVFDTVRRAWSMGPAMPAGVDNTSGAITNGTFYVMGGYDGATPVSINYSLRLARGGATDAISIASMNPEAVHVGTHCELRIDDGLGGSSPWFINSPVPEGFGVAQGSTLQSSDGSRIYHIGGFVGSGLYASSRVRVYSPADDLRDASAMQSPWWDVASVPVSRGIRSYASAVELNGFFYVFGGVSGTASSGEEVLDSTWIYDEGNDIWFRGANMPGPRFGPAVATDGAVIWVIGGYNQFQGPDHTVWRYDPKADIYTIGFTNMPRDLGRIHGVWLPDKTVHVLGGGDGGLNNHLVYNTAADAWSSAPSIPLGVLDPATVTDGTLIYLAGAPFASSPGPALTQIFNPAGSTWSEGPRLPPWPRFPDWNVDNTSGTIANGVFYVMGGAIGGGTVWFNYSIAVSELSVPNASYR
jgi:N-acetylneuraminic acid mutarotase